MRRSETPGLLCTISWQETGATMGRVGAPANRIMIAFAITATIRDSSRARSETIRPKGSKHSARADELCCPLREHARRRSSSACPACQLSPRTDSESTAGQTDPAPDSATESFARAPGEHPLRRGRLTPPGKYRLAAFPSLGPSPYEVTNPHASRPPPHPGRARPASLSSAQPTVVGHSGTEPHSD